MDKKNKRLRWGFVLFFIGAAILLLTFYYWWWLNYHASADTALSNELLVNDLYFSLIRYFGYILGGTLVISAVYIILACL